MTQMCLPIFCTSLKLTVNWFSSLCMDLTNLPKCDRSMDQIKSSASIAF